MVIWIHLVTALLALGLGMANLALAKGTPRHRAVGRAWVAAMLVVTLSSFGIRELNDGAFSWIHGLTAWTLFSLFAALYAIRRSWVRAHAGFMIGTMAGVVMAGAFALAPGRFIGTMLGY
ncbi:MAG: DUF2306 domain-containing protein [Gammaproteobacteria bacterium]|nr:DUF2306 domain-containing protein [Gammaproteobacteria bacterium]